MLPLQERLLKLLKEIDEICIRHNIEYFLYAGTLLGAVRNKGFLPWDDDADIIMTRDNWEKFKDCAPSELKEGRKLEWLGHDKDYPYVMPHYVDMKTSCIYKPRYWGLASEGTYIDMFIVDPIPSDKQKQEEYKKKLYEYIEFVDSHVLNSIEFDGDAFEKNMKECNKYGRDYVIKKYEDELFNTSIDECDEVMFRYNKLAVYLEHTPLTYIWDKKYFTDGPLYVPFEDTKLPIFHRCEGFLRQCYGDDWMIMPEDCSATHDGALRSLEIGFLDYYEDYKDKIDGKEISDKYNIIKGIVAKKRSLQTDMTKTKRTLDAIKSKIKFDKFYETLPIDEMLEKSEYDLIVQVFYPFISEQCAREHRIHYVLIDIKDDFRYACLYSLIMRGEYYIADKIFGAYKRNYNEYSDKMKEIEYISNFSRDLAISLETGDISYARDIVAKEIEKYPNHIDLICAKIKFMIEDKKDVDKIIEYIKDSLKIHPKNMEIKKLLADLSLMKNEEDLAVELYNEVLDNSRNAVMLLEINEILKSIGRERKNEL